MGPASPQPQNAFDLVYLRRVAEERPSQDVVTGALLGVAVGDSLGLPFEGMRARDLALERHGFLFGWGAVSDDTEQTALIATAIAGANDVADARRRFRWAMRGWFLRLPFGIGLGTIRACIKLMLGLDHSGVRSAGNGAAMRAPIIGAMFPHDGQYELRKTLSETLARVTHTDSRAVSAAAFCTELAALCAQRTGESRADLVDRASRVVEDESLLAALSREPQGNSGFVMHSVPLATHCFVEYGDDPMAAIRETIRKGGDTDTNAAMVGAWVGAQHGRSAFPDELVNRIVGGPFGPGHLRALGDAIANGARPPSYWHVVALLRNLAFMPVVLAHGFRRLIPF